MFTFDYPANSGRNFTNTPAQWNLFLAAFAMRDYLSLETAFFAVVAVVSLSMEQFNHTSNSGPTVVLNSVVSFWCKTTISMNSSAVFCMCVYTLYQAACMLYCAEFCSTCIGKFCVYCANCISWILVVMCRIHHHELWLYCAAHILLYSDCVRCVACT